MLHTNVQKTPVLLFMAEGYLAFSKNVPDDVVRQWQAALDQLKKSGKYDELVKVYYLSE
jgi:polar amino acid transport system substrate-binding protein